jgi:hypothetical protein
MGLQATIDELLHYRDIDDSAAESSPPTPPRSAATGQRFVRMANTRRPRRRR